MTPDRFVQPEAINAMDTTIGLHKQLNQIQPTVCQTSFDNWSLNKTYWWINWKTDKCANAHTAADDKQSKSTWKACDGTGLMGCCCRHEAVVSLANITGSGEKQKYPVAILQQVISFMEPGQEIQVLYDIGCILRIFIHLVSSFFATFFLVVPDLFCF